GGQEAVIDRQLDQKRASERQGGAAEPDQPVFGQLLLPIDFRAGGVDRGFLTAFRERDYPLWLRFPGGLGLRCRHDGRRRSFRRSGFGGRRWLAGDRLAETDQAVIDHAEFLSEIVHPRAQPTVGDQRPDRQDKPTDENGEQREKPELQIVEDHPSALPETATATWRLRWR